MSEGRVRLHREQETMLMTLYLHARDARARRPILGDAYARSVLERVDYDFGRLAVLAGNAPVICARAAAFDDTVREFLAAHPDAVVLHLGCGLDSRVQRIAPGPGVAWFDVDQQPVIDLRRRLVPARDGTTTVAASVTDAAWWADVPAGRPMLVLGEGLLMYLRPAGVHALIDAALAHPAPATALAFDTVAPWVRRISRYQPDFHRADVAFASTTADYAEAVARHPGVIDDGTRSVVSLARRASTGVMGALLAAVDALPAGHRSMVIGRHHR